MIPEIPNPKKLILVGTVAATVMCCLVNMWIYLTFYKTDPLRTLPPDPPKAKSAPESNEPQANVICPMQWVSPTTGFDAGKMPASGVLPMDWTDNPGASGYDLTVVTPNGSPVKYDVDGSSKDLFLENYAQNGTYQVVVTALDADGNPLCSITMTFEKSVDTALDPIHPQQGGDDDNNGGGSNNPSQPGIIVLPFPVSTDPPPVP